LVVETFVNHNRFNGTCYRVAGWVPLGKTNQRLWPENRYLLLSRRETKTVFLKPLHKDARVLLSAPFLPPEFVGGKKTMIDLNVEVGAEILGYKDEEVTYLTNYATRHGYSLELENYAINGENIWN
jgi:hypothetical protein